MSRKCHQARSRGGSTTRRRSAADGTPPQAQIEEDGAGIAEESEEAEETLEQSGLYGKSGWPLVLEACTLTIAAEGGDRSQIATIALAAAQNPYLVAFGAIAGHCAATGMAPSVAILLGWRASWPVQFHEVYQHLREIFLF